MIPIKTIEQLTELAARSVYLLSNMRSFQRDSEENKSIISLQKDPDCEKWEIRADEFLKDIQAVDFSPLKQLIEQLKIQNTKQEQCETFLQA